MPDLLSPLWIDTPEGVRVAADLCAGVDRFALDTEADSMHSYFHKVCLIQISADGHHMVIDPLSVEPEDLRPLWAVVEDAAVQVVMHGADYDIRILDRDFGARVAGLQDTQIMAQLLGEERTGLAALLEGELGVSLDKRYQRADWGRRPLRTAQVAYAAADTAHLADLADRLQARLEQLDRWSWAEEEFRKLERVRHTPSDPDPLAFERVKGARSLRGTDRDRLFTLFSWRDQQARARDIPPFKVLGNKALLALATSPPSDLDQLAEVHGVGPSVVRRSGRGLLRLLARPRRAPERARPPRPPATEAAVRRRLKGLLAVRDARAQDLGIHAGLLCPRSLAEAVAVRKPPWSTGRKLAEAGLEGWRLEVLGEDFINALRGDD
jgi:ribonuclease D